MFGIIGLVLGTISIVTVSYSLVVASYDMTEAAKKPASTQLERYEKATEPKNITGSY